jgi:hypothetical protein
VLSVEVDSWREKFEGIKQKWSEMSKKVSFDIEKEREKLNFEIHSTKK